jgi:phosphoadenosine phosphosulfate reductase
VRAFIKQHYPDVIWDYHAKGFWKMVEINGLPTRLNRWCCRVIKEAGGTGRVVIVGNRRSEGTIRKHQYFIEAHRNSKRDLLFLRPILNFDEYDIWQYIRENKLSVCELYQQGFKRIGCVLCPFSRNIEQEENMFPKITKLYRLAAERIVKRMKSQNYITKKGKPFKHEFKTGEELYQWWIKRD